VVTDPLIDECAREYPAIRVGRRLGSEEAVGTLAEMMVARGIPEFLVPPAARIFLMIRMRFLVTRRVRCGAGVCVFDCS
jgi:hypothetical protein